MFYHMNNNFDTPFFRYVSCLQVASDITRDTWYKYMSKENTLTQTFLIYLNVPAGRAAMESLSGIPVSSLHSFITVFMTPSFSVIPPATYNHIKHSNKLEPNILCIYRQSLS